MNDRYLFKAKVKASATGYADLDWIKGNLIVEQSTGKHFICDLSHFDSETKLCDVITEVDPSSICQCTGLKDRNGKLIWENDIIFVTDDNGNSGQIDTGIGRIDFLEGLWYISGRVQNSLYDIDKCFQIEVIGNSFDNPELLELE